MSKKQRAEAAQEIVKMLGKVDQVCACDECVSERRKVAIATIQLCAVLMAEGGL